MAEPCPTCGALPCDQTHSPPAPGAAGGSVADCAVSWLTTIGVEVGRDEPDLGERILMLVQAAIQHVRIRERVTNG